MIKVTFDQASLTKLTNTLKDSAAKIGNEVAIAINATSKQCSIKAARLLKEEIKVPVKILKKAVRPGIKANRKSLTTTITLGKGHPIPIKYFLGKVKEKITKKQKTAIGESFLVRRYREHYYKRAGRKRGPLVRINGPEPGDAFEKAGISEVTLKTARDELPKQVEERIRFWGRKLAGELRGKQK